MPLRSALRKVEQLKAAAIEEGWQLGLQSGERSDAILLGRALCTNALYSCIALQTASCDMERLLSFRALARALG